MKIELENFIIKSDKPIKYIEKIINTLNSETKKILSFFGINRLENKLTINIYTSKEKFKNYKISRSGYYYDWMCADTTKDQINILDIKEARKSNRHKDMTLDDFKHTLLHEFVHSCQMEINDDIKGVVWFWEALATNLSGQTYQFYKLSECDFNNFVNDFYNTEHDYNYAYIIGKYMLKNYSQDIILNYVKHPELLRKDATTIFNELIEKEKDKKEVIKCQC